VKAEMLDVLVKLLSISTLFSLGAGASGQSLIQEFKNRSHWLALCWSVILFPVLVFLTGNMFIQDKNLLIGIYLGAASAGGSSAGILIKKIKGDEIFSGSLLISQSIFSVILVPVSLANITQKSSEVNTVLLPLLFVILLYQLAPFIMGIILSRWKYRLNLILKSINVLNIVILVILIAGFIAAAFQSLLEIQSFVLFFVFSVNLVLFFAMPLYRLMGGVSRIKAMSATVGIRNLTTALFMSSVFGLDSKAELGILVYGFFMYVVATLWTILVSRRHLY
jgi:BASS family bile acid:Na+ symporter